MRKPTKQERGWNVRLYETLEALEKFRKNLTKEQAEELIKKLEAKGFKFEKTD